MKTMVKTELRQNRNILLVWLGLSLILTGFCYFEFLSLKDSLDEMARMMEQFPRILLIMFGVKADLSTSLGWYSCLYFWMSILSFAYAMYLGITCVAKEKKWHTAEYLFTKPVTRREIVLAKVIASGINLCVFSVFSGICSFVMVVLPAGGLEQRGAELLTYLGLFLTQLLFFATGLLIASLFRQYRSAVKMGALAMLAFYAVAIAVQYLELPALDFLSPLRYFDAYELILHGFRLPYLLLTGVLLLAFVGIAVKRWQDQEL